jgi:hypothetical protein
VDIVIEFNPSAFKHGVTEADIRTAVERSIYDNMLPGNGDATEEKHLLIGLLIGLDTNANLLEVIYNVIDGQTVNVFHTMKCRKAYLSLVNF